MMKFDKRYGILHGKQTVENELDFHVPSIMGQSYDGSNAKNADLCVLQNKLIPGWNRDKNDIDQILRLLSFFWWVICYIFDSSSFKKASSIQLLFH